MSVRISLAKEEADFIYEVLRFVRLRISTRITDPSGSTKPPPDDLFALQQTRSALDRALEKVSTAIHAIEAKP